MKGIIMRKMLLITISMILISWSLFARSESLQFVNRCSYTIDVGRTWNAPFARILPGSTYTRNLGADNVARPAIAIYAFRKDRNGGAGNATLAEFTLNHGGIDYYDVSIVDAFSVPMAIRPIGRDSCPVASCLYDLISACPASGKLIRNGVTIACSKKGDRDNPNNPVAKLVAQKCPDAYSWSRSQGTKGCNGSKDFSVMFCDKF
jgi:hypothetical protein